MLVGPMLQPIYLCPSKAYVYRKSYSTFMLFRWVAHIVILSNEFPSSLSLHSKQVYA